MLKVYLAGEIHTNWREEKRQNREKQNLNIKKGINNYGLVMREVKLWQAEKVAIL